MEMLYGEEDASERKTTGKTGRRTVELMPISGKAGGQQTEKYNTRSAGRTESGTSRNLDSNVISEEELEALLREFLAT